MTPTPEQLAKLKDDNPFCILRVLAELDLCDESGSIRTLPVSRLVIAHAKAVEAFAKLIDASDEFIGFQGTAKEFEKFGALAAAVTTARDAMRELEAK